MKKILKIASSCLATILCSSGVLADTSDFYVGLDVLKTNYSTQERYGRNVFGRDPMAFNAFVGYKLPMDFFIEMGYERARTKERTARVGEGGYYPGATLPYAANVYEVFRTKIKFERPYLGVGFNYFLPKYDNTYFTVFTGLTITRIQAQFEIIGDDVMDPYNTLLIDFSRRTFSKRKIEPMLKTGINHNFSNKFGVRLVGAWHKLTNFKIQSSEDPNIARLRFKNGYAICFGVLYTF